MKDSFDEYLKFEIKKSEHNIPDNGFSESVIKSLPKRKTAFINRRFIIIFSSIVSAFVFILMNGMTQFVPGFLNFINDVMTLNPINVEFLTVLIVFCIMSISISFVELGRRIL